MNMQELWTKLSSVVELSRRIVGLAEKKDWAQLAGLDQQRRCLLEDILSNAPVSELDERVKQDLQLVAQLNDQALRLCAESRRSLTTCSFSTSANPTITGLFPVLFEPI